MYQVIGFRKTEFSPKDRPDQTFHGTQLYVIYQQDGVTGYAAERVYVSDANIGDYQPHIDDYIDIHYNRFGKVASVQFVRRQ